MKYRFDNMWSKRSDQHTALRSYHFQSVWASVQDDQRRNRRFYHESRASLSRKRSQGGECCFSASRCYDVTASNNLHALCFSCLSAVISKPLKPVFVHLAIKSANISRPTPVRCRHALGPTSRAIGVRISQITFWPCAQHSSWTLLIRFVSHVQ